MLFGRREYYLALYMASQLWKILALLGFPGKEDQCKLLRRGLPGDRESCDVSKPEVVM